MATRSDLIKQYTKRGHRYYKLCFQFRGYRIRRSGYASYSEAIQVASDIRLKILQKNFEPEEYFNNKQEDITLNEMWHQHYKPYAERVLKNSTYYVRVKEVEKKILPKIGHRLLKSITSQVMEKTWELCRADGDSEAYVGTHWICLRAILKYAVMIGHLDVLPDAKKPRYKKSVKRILTLSEIKKMYQWGVDSGEVEEEILNMFVFLFMTAVRVGECRAINEKDICFKDMTISIDKRIYRGVIDSPKNNKLRKIPIHHQLVPFIHRQMLINSKMRTGLDGVLFRSSHSGKRISKYYFWKRIKLMAREALGNDVEISAHALRRSLASVMVSANIPVDEASAMLRNTPQVLLQHYNKADTEQFKVSFNELSLMNEDLPEIGTLKAQE